MRRLARPHVRDEKKRPSNERRGKKDDRSEQERNLRTEGHVGRGGGIGAELVELGRMMV